MPMKTRSPAWSRDFRISRQQRSSCFWISCAPRTRALLRSVFPIGDAHHRVQQDFRPEADLIGVGPFEWAVADALFTRDEDHPGGRDLRDLHRVVPRAGRHDLVGDLFLLTDVADHADQAGVEVDRLLGADRQDVDLHVALGGDLLRAPLDGTGDAVLRFAGDATDIDGELDLAGNRIDDAGIDLDRADGADDAAFVHRRVLARRLLDVGDKIGGGRERVLAHVHRRRARVVGLSGEDYAQPRRRGDRGHDADLLAFRFEHRALLDVQLEIGFDRFGIALKAGQAVAVDAEAREDFAELGAARVDGVGEIFHLHLAGDEARAERRKAEAARLLPDEADRFDGAGERDAAFFYRPHRFQRPDDADRAVEFAAVDDAVEMRAGEHRRTVGAFEAAEDVADAVDVDLEPGLRHQMDEQLPAAQLGHGKNEPRHRAAVADADSRDRVEIGEQALSVDRRARGGCRWPRLRVR